MNISKTSEVFQKIKNNFTLPCFSALYLCTQWSCHAPSVFAFHFPGSNFVWSHKTGRGTLDATECLIKTFFFKYSYWAHLPFFPMAIEWCVWGRDWRLKQWSWVKLSVGSKQSSCLTKVGKWISDFPSHHTSIMINHVQFQIFCRSVQPSDPLWNDHKLMMKIMKINRNEKWVFTEEKLHLLAS